MSGDGTTDIFMWFDWRTMVIVEKLSVLDDCFSDIFG
jgi:hypothetical protein